MDYECVVLVVMFFAPKCKSSGSVEVKTFLACSHILPFDNRTPLL